MLSLYVVSSMKLMSGIRAYPYCPPRQNSLSSNQPRPQEGPLSLEPASNPDNGRLGDNAPFAAFISNNVPALIGSSIDDIEHTSTVVARYA